MSAERSYEQIASAGGKLLVVDEFVKNEDEVRRLYEQMSPTIADGPGSELFVALEDVRQRAEECTAELRSYFDDASPDIVSHLRRLVDFFPSSKGVAPRYLSFWANSCRANFPRMTVPHFDSDVFVTNVGPNAKPPLWGTILYLGPGPEGGLEGGETTFCLEHPIPAALREELFVIRQETDNSFRALSPDWVTVHPRRNRFVMFHGGLAHLMEITAPRPGHPRITLLVNAWADLALKADDVHGKLILRSRCFSDEQAREKILRTSRSLEHDINALKLSGSIAGGP